MKINLSVSQLAVYKEVEQTTSYTGAKMVDDAGAYERIATIDEDRTALKRFWDESCATLAQTLKRFVVSEGLDGDTYAVELKVSSAFKDAFVRTMNDDLFSFFVQSIVSKWCTYANKPEAEMYGEQATQSIGRLLEKVYFMKRPNRL